MNPNDFTPGDYVAVYEPDGRLRTHGTVSRAAVTGFWVDFPNGAAALIPSERLRRVATAINPKELVSVPHPDPVIRAQAEYDRLNQAQVELDSRRAELYAEKTEAMRQANEAEAKMEDIKDERKANSTRMFRLASFINMAKTI